MSPKNRSNLRRKRFYTNLTTPFTLKFHPKKFSLEKLTLYDERKVKIDSTTLRCIAFNKNCIKITQRRLQYQINFSFFSLFFAFQHTTKSCRNQLHIVNTVNKIKWNAVCHTFASSNLPNAFNKFPKSLRTQYKSCWRERKIAKMRIKFR